MEWLYIKRINMLLGWFEKGVLMQEDLVEIEALYQKQEVVEEVEESEIITEETENPEEEGV